MHSHETDHASPLKGSTALYTGFGLFLVIFVLFGVTSAGVGGDTVGTLLNYVAAAWHVVAFFIVAAVAAPLWAKGAGFTWAAIDGLVDVMNINGADADLAWTLRLGSHIALGMFLIGASWVTTGAVRVVGYLTAAVLMLYSWFTAFLPEQTLTAAMVLLLAWLLMTARGMHSDDATTTTHAAPM